ncbi:hypothetical protein OCF84_20680 (plasmid) [Shewanella xiamenensis]|uniref:Uncharacterized protein n=1 Tax=Shewanella xiamenensis TaxID=332186 RepID=A0ABT6UFS0_9GAMM|nr:hypothetical protein [Shewanella xiamenensis]MDI5833315.1 hypothetical protein [Shewanella xiamenensis]WHF57934.1 hypothetical protein OCF84_20680 [Shewanella xiamenensis]
MDETTSINKGRRLLLKGPLLILTGATLSMVSNPAKADPIKIIVDAMSMAAKYVLDVAIEMVEGMLDNLLDSFMSQNGEKVGKIGDGLNTVQSEIFKRKIMLDTAPAPRLCDTSDKNELAKLRRNSNSDVYDRLNTNSDLSTRNFVIGMATGKDHDYGRTLTKWARERGILSTSSVGANSERMTFNIGSLIKDGVRFVNEQDKKSYLDTVDIMTGPSRTSKQRPLDSNNDSPINIELNHYMDSRVAVTAAAASILLSEYHLVDSGKLELMKNEISNTYYSAGWRNETQQLPSSVPAAINLIQLKSTKIEILFEILLQLDKSILLRSVKVAKELNKNETRR